MRESRGAVQAGRGRRRGTEYLGKLSGKRIMPGQRSGEPAYFSGPHRRGNRIPLGECGNLSGQQTERNRYAFILFLFLLFRSGMNSDAR